MVLRREFSFTGTVSRASATPSHKQHASQVIHIQFKGFSKSQLGLLVINPEKLTYFAKPAQLPACGALPQIVHASESTGAPNSLSNSTAEIRVNTKEID